MSLLRAPGLGPIVGHTSDKTARIWIRANEPDDEGSNLSTHRRTIGIIGVLNASEKVDPSKIYYFRLHREYDRTGTFVLGEYKCLSKDKTIEPLVANTEYKVRVGTLTLDAPSRNDEIFEDGVIADSAFVDKLPSARNWAEELNSLPEEASVACFKTYADTSIDGAPIDQMSFIFGSCRYTGFFAKAKQSDLVFGPVLKEASRKRSGIEASFVLMAGDQIYADQLNRFPLMKADTFEEFQERYHSAFKTPNMRKLLRSKPIYMILDDHEIEDNWSKDRLDETSFFQIDKKKLFNMALDRYMSYQWSHGPRNFGQKLYYTFDCGGYPFFVCDLRTQRRMNSNGNEVTLDDNHMMGRPSYGMGPQSQVDRLTNWLKSQPKNVPKFIVLSSVFAPNPISARNAASVRSKEKSDSWPAFPETRRAILECIVENDIQNVIFVSGDIHCANFAEMYFESDNQKFENAKNLKLYNVTSSAFHWPFPMADGEPSDFVQDSKHPKQKDPFVIFDGEVTMNYTAKNFTQQNNFTRITVDKNKAHLNIKVFDEKGNIAIEEDGAKKLEASLKLEPW